MKALMGKLASHIRRDTKGREELRKVITSQLDNQEITLSDGTTYIISRTNPNTTDNNIKSLKIEYSMLTDKLKLQILGLQKTLRSVLITLIIILTIL